MASLTGWEELSIFCGWHGEFRSCFIGFWFADDPPAFPHQSVAEVAAGDPDAERMLLSLADSR